MYGCIEELCSVITMAQMLRYRKILLKMNLYFFYFPINRKILNDLSSPVPKMEDDSNSSQSNDGHDSCESK